MAPLAAAALLPLLLLAGGGAPGQRGGRVKYAGLLGGRSVSNEGLGGGEAVQAVAQLQRERPRKAEVSVGIDTGMVVNRIRDEFVSFNLDSTFDRGFFSRNLDNPHLVYLAKQLATAVVYNMFMTITRSMRDETESPLLRFKASHPRSACRAMPLLLLLRDCQVHLPS
eukprot:COSAG01_NODE_3807_length_5677_cov_7.965041_2_plen_168_part_00